MKLLFFTLVVSSFLFVRCNPARRITMKNVGSDTAQVVWTAREDSIGFNPFVMNNSRSLKFSIPPNKNNEINMSFGIGAWTPEYLNGFLKYLVAVEVTSRQQNFKLDSAEKIKEFFLTHRKKRSTVVEILLQ
ncbi:MAG: hypothetical protein M3Y85_11770 [Bacteroidota bacterium]|nr:hypothetical protein [Bacteroidota bacterium]